jgi:hypothetical protein
MRKTQQQLNQESYQRSMGALLAVLTLLSECPWLTDADIRAITNSLKERR